MTVEVDIRGERFTVEDYTIFPFWETFNHEPGTYDVLDRYLRPDKDFLDIGAWIGPLTLYASRKCRRVVAVEPDRVARHHLETNLMLNAIDNVDVRTFAVAGEAGCYWFGTSTELGDSMSSLCGDDGAAYEVTAFPLPAVAAEGDFSLIKIDTEGAEAAIIPAAEEWIRGAGIPIWLATHAPNLDDAARGALAASLHRLGVALPAGYAEVLIAP